MNKGITITSINQPWKTECGYTFPATEIAWKSWGKLNARRDNVILICHALTGHAAADEWFSGLFGNDGFLDPEKHFILCINVPGSCYGSTGPVSINPQTGTAYQANFPELSIRDFVTFQQQLLDYLNVRKINLVLGGSMGGMTALEFAIMDERVQAAACFAMSKTHSPWAIGISHAQRKAIFADPNWNSGFYDPENPPAKGLAAARAMAMITYRAPQNYDEKFLREIHPEKNVFQVESYLDYQGEKLAERFDANTYVILSKAMDRHDVARGRGSYKNVLQQVEKPMLIVGIDSDILYPIHEQEELAALLPQSIFGNIHSPFGHDAFLIEFEQLNKHLKTFQHSLTLTSSADT